MKTLWDGIARGIVFRTTKKYLMESSNFLFDPNHKFSSEYWMRLRHPSELGKEFGYLKGTILGRNMTKRKNNLMIWLKDLDILKII